MKHETEMSAAAHREPCALQPRPSTSLCATRPTTELLEEVLHALRPLSLRRELRVNFADERAPNDRDEQPIALARVLRSLGATAIELTAMGASLCFRIGAASDDLEIELDSIGARGVSKRKELAKLYRVRRNVPPRAGFAMHAASAFADAHAGSLHVEYVEQLGVHITLRLPLGSPPTLDHPDAAEALLEPGAPRRACT